MAYNNNNRNMGYYPAGRPQEYGYSPFQGNSNNYGNRSYGGNGGYNNRQQKQDVKRSGAVYTKINTGGNKDGLFQVNAWRKTKYGLMTASCTPYEDYDSNGNAQGVTIHKGKEKGHEFIRYRVQLTMNGQVQKFYTLMRLDTKVINIPELSLCITPNGSGYTSSGKRVSGYFGSNFRRK